MEKIGIYGGAFNPVHIFHLIIAERFVEQAQLDFCYFVPAYISPFKTEDTTSPVDSLHRLNMAGLAIEDNPKFRLSTFEIDKGGVSYTYDTVRYFRQEHKHVDFYMLAGMDQAVEFKKWNNWEKILEEASLCIVPRPESLSPDNTDYVNSLDCRKKVIWIDSPAGNLSSTYVRTQVKEGKSIKYLVPDKVEQYIKQNNLYI